MLSSGSTFAAPLTNIPTHLLSLRNVKLSSPRNSVLLIRLNRPKALNVFTEEMEDEVRQVMEWAETDKAVWVIVLTGEGSAFCAGGDLKPVLQFMEKYPTAPIPPSVFYGPTSDGFGYLSRRPHSSKPIIAAVNGLAFGGGMEIVLNCDIILASERAKFGFGETKSGLVAIHGAIPRLARASGHQLASEAFVLGRTITSREAFERFKFVNRVVPAEEVLPSALEFAEQIVSLAISASNDKPGHALEAIQTTKRALVQSRRWMDVPSHSSKL